MACKMLGCDDDEAERLSEVILSGTLHKNYMNLHVAVHYTVTNLEKRVCITKKLGRL